MSIRIDTDTLSYYVHNAQIPLADLRKSIKHLDEFLAGERQPTFNQLSEIAKKIHIPTGLLLLKKSINIKQTRAEFRKLTQATDTAISDGLRDTIIDMQEKQDFLRNEIEYKIEFIGKHSIDQSPMSVSESIRNILDLPVFFQEHLKDKDKAFKYLRQKANDVGIFVFIGGVVGQNTRRPLDVTEFRGFVLSDDKAPIIFINQTDSKAGQLFTLIHEIVHLFIGNDEIFRVVDTGEFVFDKVEAFVNRITAELLVPSQMLEQFQINSTKEDIAQLANLFLVSEFVIARRLLELKKLSKAEYKQMTEQLTTQPQKKVKNNSGGNYHNNLRFRMDNRFLGYIAQSINRERISPTEALGIMGVGYRGYQSLLEGKT